MKGLARVRQHVRFGTLSKNIYREIMPLLVRENNDTLSGLSVITVIFGGVLSLLSVLGMLSQRVLPAYLFLFLTSIAFILFRRLLPRAQEDKRISFLTCYLQCAALLGFGMLNSSVFSPDPNSNGTIFVVTLLVVPFLMVDVPYRMDPLLIAFTGIYCALIQVYKAPGVISLDVTNTVSVCLVSCTCNWIFASKNMQNLANRLYIEKERDSDSLTGLLTKQSARILTDTLLGNGGHGVFLILDLDNFKYVNDSRGHLYGDEVLTRVANCIKQNTRRTDVAARFGGDEFTIFFPEMEAAAAEKKADDILWSVRQSFAAQPIQVTCSIGMTAAAPAEEYDALFQEADKALYESKKLGKDRYTLRE